MPRRRHPLIVADALLGAAAGAAMGTLTAGPPGALAGALIGGAVGAVAGNASERGEAQIDRENEALDEAIGVTSGRIGEASPNQPPARIGAFSGAAMGADAGEGEEVAAGPIQSIDED